MAGQQPDCGEGRIRAPTKETRENLQSQHRRVLLGKRRNRVELESEMKNRKPNSDVKEM